MKNAFLAALLAACLLPAAQPVAQPVAHERGEASATRSLSAAPTDTLGQALTPSADAPVSLERRIAELEAQLQALEAEQQRMAAADAERVEVSGEIFTRYGWNTTGTEATRDFNSFSLDRLYLTATGDLAETVSFRGTTDIVTTDPEARLGYAVIVKFAYFDWEMRPWLALRAGMMQTGWANYVTKVWGYRALSKVLVHEQGYLSTADLGAALTAKLPNQLGEAVIGVHNGRGYRSPEFDSFKDLSARLVLTPFARTSGWASGLQAGGHAYQGTHPDGHARVRYGGLIGYERAGYRLGLNVETRTDGDVQGTGVSAFGALPLGEMVGLGKFAILALVEGYDPDHAASADRELRGVVGLAVQPSAGLTLALDYQHARAQRPVFDRYDGTSTRADAGVFLHVIVKY